MAGEMLLINPRPRARRRNPMDGRRRRRNPLDARRRRRNPINPRYSVASPRRRAMTISRHHRHRRRNPIGDFGRLRIGRRRRRNPIGIAGLNANSLMSMFKDAAIGGAGAIVMDLAMGQINTFLPASFQTVKGQVSIGDAVKAGITALLGQALSKSTRGLSRRMAAGALTVQAYEIMSGLIPATMTVGFSSPARIVHGSNRVGPTRGGMDMAAYLPKGRTSLLNAYVNTKPPLLNRAMSTAQREGVTTYR